MSFDFEIIQINASENDARVGWRRQQSNVRMYGRVQARPLDRDGPLDGKLVRHEVGSQAFDGPFAYPVRLFFRII